MHQAIATRKDVHECPKRGDVHHLSVVDLPNISGGRIQYQADLALSLIYIVTVGRGDGNDASVLAVVNIDLSSGLRLNGIYDLALGADHLTDLVQRDLELDDLGSSGTDIIPGGVEGLGHHLQNLEPSIASLVQSIGQHISRQPVDLRVELQRGHEVSRACDLEVHIAECIFGAQDVGERGVATLMKHQSHGDASHRRFDGHARIHERQR